jgi:anti-sigma factor RsiW
MTSPPPRPLGDALRDALPTYQAPKALHAWARTQAAAQSGTTVRRLGRRRLRLLAYAAGLVVAGAIGSLSKGSLDRARYGGGGHSELEASLVDAHVRSLMANHLTDVRSSDRHTVKPWFAGKVPFAPSVPELVAQGFPLVGGRVEYVGGHTAAALVYGRRLHTINLFIWPAASGEIESRGAAYHGYGLAHWIAGGSSFWAVSDVAAADLAAFEAAYRSAP